MEIIALSGYARSGKDETAKVLVEEFGFQRVAFADKLRDMLYQLNPYVLGIFDGMGRPHTVIRQLQMVIDEYGWNGYKETMFGDEIRRLLQRLGTEAGRETLWDTIWIDAAFAGLPDDAKIVITDCRFKNEAKAVEERGGSIWRISRKGVGPANAHPSETGLDGYDFRVNIVNNGTLEQLHNTVRSIYGRDGVKAKVFAFCAPMEFEVDNV